MQSHLEHLQIVYANDCVHKQGPIEVRALLVSPLFTPWSSESSLGSGEKVTLLLMPLTLLHLAFYSLKALDKPSSNSR